MGAYLSARQAAEVCGVSEKTIRNWIANGKLSAYKSAAGFRIAPEHLEPLIAESARTSAGAERNGADGADFPRIPSADVSAPALLELVHLVDRLQADVVTKAEAAAMWQARAQHLQAERDQLAEQLRALPAPASMQTAPPGAADVSASEPSPQPDARKRPWWRLW